MQQMSKSFDPLVAPKKVEVVFKAELEGLCPTCGSLIFKEESICPCCGQKLDWEAPERKEVKDETK